VNRCRRSARLSALAFAGLTWLSFAQAPVSPQPRESPANDRAMRCEPIELVELNAMPIKELRQVACDYMRANNLARRVTEARVAKTSDRTTQTALIQNFLAKSQGCISGMSNASDVLRQRGSSMPKSCPK